MHEKLFKMYDTRRDVWKETDEKLCDVVYRKITVVAKTFSGRNIELIEAINRDGYKEKMHLPIFFKFLFKYRPPMLTFK